MRSYDNYSPAVAAAMERSDAAWKRGDKDEAWREIHGAIAVASPADKKRLKAALQKIRR